MLQNLCDTHVHTIFSRHAYSTLEEDVRAAADAGLELLGVADHFSAMIAPCGDFRAHQHFGNEAVWPRRWHGVTLLRAAEVDIMDLSGRLFGQGETAWGLDGNPLEGSDFFGFCLRSCDYLVASVHGRQLPDTATPAQGTALYGAVLENPKVLMLGHIGRAGVPFEVKAVVRAAKELHKLIEVNEHSLELAASPFFGDDIPALCRTIAERCAEEGVSIAVNTDAHISYDVGKTPHALAMLEEIHFPQELVATRSAAAFLEAVEQGVGPVEGL